LEIILDKWEKKRKKLFLKINLFYGV
jgi:hypothetical protein